MNPLRKLIIIAITANLLTVILFKYSASQPGGTGASLAFVVLWMPAVWITTIILTLILALRRRKELFNNCKSKRKWAVIALLFCTPIPVYLINQLLYPTPETLRSSSSYSSKDGKIYKSESWYYSSNYQQKYVDMYFVADSSNEIMNVENAFQKDSTWIYFSKLGDTLKVEKYNAGQLISEKTYTKK